MTPKLPFTSLSYITPQFQPHEPHLQILALERKRRAQEWEFNCDFQEKRGFCSSFQGFSSHQNLWVKKNFSKYENLKLLTQFSNTRHSFIKLQTFSFIKPHETHFSIMDCINLISIESHEIHLGIEWDMFLHDPCHSSPFLITNRWWIFESWSNEFYSSKSNSVCFYELYEWKGIHGKKPILIFLVRPFVTLQLPVWLLTKIFKSQ